MDIPISCWIQGFNEEQNLPKVLSSIKGIDDIVYIDHESTDNSVEIAKSLGAKTYIRTFIKEKTTEDDVTDFLQRFGYEPSFGIGEDIPVAWKERTECQKYCKNDWVLNLDCDEVLTWDIDKVKKLLSNYDIINCRYYHERNPDGSRMDWFQTNRLYNRKKTFWIGRLHEVLNGYDLRVGWTDDMEIDHYSKYREYKIGYTNPLEYAVLRDQDSRSFYYLGKEYHYWGKWEKAIKILTLYLKESWYVAEKVKAYLMIADSMWNLGSEDEAYVYATQALKLNPMSKEAYLFLAKIAPKREEKIWLQHAELAVNDHLL